MGKAARAKRRRATVRSAKRARNNSWWYGVTALVVIAGVALIVYARATAPSPVGPLLPPATHDTHWHAALGVYDCDKWLGDSSGTGIWNWPYVNAQGSPSRADDTSVYAGMHSHDDGIIHMEPATSDEAGKNATVGRYFQFGGWKLSSTGYDFLGTKVQNGTTQCGSTPGTLQWEVGKFNGDATAKQTYKVMTGDPGKYKLFNDDIVVIAFLPPGKSITSIGDPPSLAKLPDAAARANNPITTTTTGTPGATTSTTGAATTTTVPAGATTSTP